MASLTCTALLEIQKMAFEKERRELREAALFEARVAAQLATWETLPVPCMNDTYCDKSSLVCPSCRLKYARLQVEEEMNNA